MVKQKTDVPAGPERCRTCGREKRRDKYAPYSASVCCCNGTCCETCGRPRPHVAVNSYTTAMLMNSCGLCWLSADACRKSGSRPRVWSSYPPVRYRVATTIGEIAHWLQDGRRVQYVIGKGPPVDVADISAITPDGSPCSVSFKKSNGRWTGQINWDKVEVRLCYGPISGDESSGSDAVSTYLGLLEEMGKLIERMVSDPVDVCGEMIVLQARFADLLTSVVERSAGNKADGK